MKEVLYTIPLNDAVNAGGECPFCNIEKDVEQDLLDFVLGSGSSYMEADVRADTDAEGFCRKHFKKMFEYGNTLGNGWILKTHYMKINKEMHSVFEKFSPSKGKGLFGSSKQTNSAAGWIRKKEESCYICKRYEQTYERYLATFIHMYRNDEEFVKKIFEGKGFCLSHLADILEYADNTLNDKEKAEFFPRMFKLTEDNMQRLYEDVSWLVEKFDYRNKDADWKDSKDAVQRGMQKLKGGIYD
ncbi:MAG: DUF6062 family protein [Lachnospiraceae bacterium]|nr:DUF6062 family protein [Lachnospiraceae bacterium]